MTTAYVLPTSTQALPNNLTLIQFIQSILVGVSGIAGEFVRPRWQPDPAKQPALTKDWIAFSITNLKKDFNAYIDTTKFIRHEDLEIMCAVYGPNCQSIAEQILDGLQIPQNREALTAAGLGITAATDAMHMPDIVNERWIDKYEISIFMKREVNRAYSIGEIASAEGVIEAQAAVQTFISEWDIQPPVVEGN